MPAIILGLTAAGAPIAGGLAKGLLGVGKDTTATTDYQETAQYNPDDHEYGGYANGARDQANYYQQIGADVGDRAAPTADFSGAQPDYQYAGQAASMASADRNAASNVAGLMYQRATGAIPTVAEQQGAIDMRRVAAQQAATAASARGAAGVALAGQTAANNTANAQQGIAGQTQVNAAQERAGYTQSASNAFTGLNSMDANARDAEIARQQYNANLATQQRQFNAQQQLQSRSLNDQTGLGYNHLANDVRAQQLNANLQNQGQLSGSFDKQQVNHAQRGAENAGYENQNWAAAGSSGSGGGGPPVAGKAKGGPVAPGQPYIVGEKGPELLLRRGGRTAAAQVVGADGPEIVTPEQPGYVIPNNRLRQMAPSLASGGAAIQRNGLQGMGARDTASMLDDRSFQNERGVPTAGLDAALAAQAERDRQDAAAAAAQGPRMSQADWERRLVKSTQPTEPVRPVLRRGGARWGNDNANADAARGVAPGTTDFESTEPKKDKAGPGAVAILDAARRGFFGGARADGGPVAGGTSYLVGEHGPEAFMPYAGPADADTTAAAFSGGGGIRNVSPIGQYRQASNFAAQYANNSGGAADYGREEGGPVRPGDRVLVGEKGPEVVVAKPTSSQATYAQADEQSKRADERALKGVAQMLLVPGGAASGLVDLGRSAGDSVQAIGTYLRARDQAQKEANQPVYVQQPAVTREEWRRAADEKAARLAAEAAPVQVPSHVDQPKTEQGKLAALHDWLFATGQAPQAVALARGSR